MGSFSLLAAAAKTCSSTSRLLSGPGCVHSTTDKLSSTRSRAIGGKSPRSTSGSNDHFADATRRAYHLRVSSMWCVLLFLARPRFSLESDADLDRIPRAYADREHGRMRCSGNRCAALVGDVGISTACAIYAVRPDVCRACLPGDDSCKMARRHFNL